MRPLRIRGRAIPWPALVRVRGRSMSPTLRDGDLLVVLHAMPPRPGGMAVLRLPADASGAPRPLSVKRVTGPDPEDPRRWWVDSDNPREGVNSFDVGSLAADAVVARVVCRLPRLRRPSEPNPSGRG